jgi:hypothetical membrane protein
LAAAGVLGPVLFTVGFLLLGLLRRGEYDPVAEQVSNLTAGPYGWAQQVNFIVFGLLLLAFAAGLHRGMWPTRGGVTGPALLGCNGVGLVLAGLFPLREGAAGRVYDPIRVHSINGRIFLLSISIALVLVSLRLRAIQAGAALLPIRSGRASHCLCCSWWSARWRYRPTRHSMIGWAWCSGLCWPCGCRALSSWLSSCGVFRHSWLQLGENRAIV